LLAGFRAGDSIGESMVPVEPDAPENESVAGPACLLHHMDSSYKSHWRKRTGQQCSLWRPRGQARMKRSCPFEQRQPPGLRRSYSKDALPAPLRKIELA
jgi:hypothetical protein